MKYVSEESLKWGEKGQRPLGPSVKGQSEETKHEREREGSAWAGQLYCSENSNGNKACPALPAIEQKNAVCHGALLGESQHCVTARWWLALGWRGEGKMDLGHLL